MLSENYELISLVKILEKELNVDLNLIKAIESYIDILKKNNKSSYFIHRSKYFLLKLSEKVYGIEKSGIGYRHAVDALLASIDKDDRAFCINLTRGFYPFWKNAHTVLIRAPQLQISKLSSKNLEIADLWKSVEEMFLSESEDWLINLYKNAMQSAGASESEVEARVKLAKLIQYELRNHAQTSEGYRKAIEIIECNFLRIEFRNYFKVVSREFYQFWTNLDSKSNQCSKVSTGFSLIQEL